MSYEIEVEIVGIAPMAQHRLTDEDIDQIDKSTTGGRKASSSKKDEAIERMYYRPDGYIGMPKRNIKACLLEGIRKANLKYGRASLAPYVKATVFIKENMPSLGITEPEFIERFPVQRKDGTQVIVVRGGLNTGWKLSFTLLVIDERRDSDQLKVGMEEAGILCGLGAGRPEYGRFEVAKWKVIRG